MHNPARRLGPKKNVARIFLIVRCCTHHGTSIEIDGDRPVELVSADVLPAIRDVGGTSAATTRAHSGAEQRRGPQ